MSTGTGFELLEQRLTIALYPGGTSISPAELAAILAIINALAKVLQDCQNPKPQALRVRFLNRTRVAMSLRRHADMGWGEAFRMSDKVFDLAKQATDDELQSLIEDCCS